MAKTTFSFTLDGVKYTDIKGYDGTSIYIGLTGTAQMIRQYLKVKYPLAAKRGYSSVSSSGSSIDIRFNDAPEEIYKKISAEIKRKFQEGYFDGMTDSYVNTKPNETSEEGLVISYGARYIFTYTSMGGDVPAVDWTDKSKPSKPEIQPKPESQQGVEVLKVCSGWTITKRLLSGGKIVYNAKINPDTKKNTTDWNTIKSEVYIETGFKWGKFSSFDKWGQIASEAFVIKRLCEVLGKYYTGDTQPDTKPETETKPEPDTTGKFVYGETWGVPRNNGTELIEILRNVWQYEVIWSSNAFYIKSKTEPKPPVIIISDNGGEFNLTNKFDGSYIESINYVTDNGIVSVEDLASQINIIYGDVFPDLEDEKPDTSIKFIYGENFAVPTNYGQELIEKLKSFDYEVDVVSKNLIQIRNKNNQKESELSIYDSNGKFNITDWNGLPVTDVKYASKKSDGSIKPFNIRKLAVDIDDIYQKTYPVTEDEKPDTPDDDEFKIDESYKSLPRNPKLEYLRIEWAEGLIAYADTFPREFQSFTAATKYIADNIGEIRSDGTYDKHKIVFKWKFDDKEQSERWAIANDLNPKTHKNLYAYKMVLIMCYNSWRAAETDQGFTATADDFYAEVVGKDGLELNDAEFNNLLNFLIDNHYVNDDWIKIQGRELRLERFKIHYPKVYALYNQPKTQKTRADIEKAIAGLQYLADKGNEKASKAIAGLKYLLK
jgi:hypothetical protein